MRIRIKTALALPALAALAVALAPAGALGQTIPQRYPSAVLIFPYVDAGSSSPTVISITNTYLRQWKTIDPAILPGGNASCPNSGRKVGDTGVELIFFYSDNNGTCKEADTFITLTPGDHATFLASDLGFPSTTGWLVALACDPDFPVNVRPWTFDFLAGVAHVVDGDKNLSWTYNPYAFWSIAVPLFVPIDPTQGHCGKFYWDDSSESLGDDDGRIDFNLLEIWPMSDDFVLPRFYEDDGTDFDSKLVLISPFNTLEGEHDSPTTFYTLFWNNDENGNGFPFSKTKTFTCQTITTLRDISPQFSDLGGTTANNEEPTGWAILDGYTLRDSHGDLLIDPPILGVFAQFDKTLGDAAKHAGGNDFFVRGFNEFLGEIPYRFGQ